MKKSLKLMLAVFIGTNCLLAQTAFADAEPYELDKSHADITFTVSHLGYSSTHGRFNEFDGKLLFDANNPGNSSVEVTIVAGSIETSWAKRNTHLKSADFFNIDKYPTMQFVSTEIVMESENTGKLTGNLTMLDQTHPVTLDLTINKVAPHPRSNKMTFGVTATGVLQRSNWGMDKFVPGIADDIELRLDMEASEKEAA